MWRSRSRSRGRVLAPVGREVENSVPTVMRAEPFAEVNSMLGPNGERWVPVHGTVAFSKASAMFESLRGGVRAASGRDAAARHRSRVFDVHGGSVRNPDRGRCSIGRTPVCRFTSGCWPPIISRSSRSTPRIPRLRSAWAELEMNWRGTFMEQGAVSFQLGKFYPFQDGLAPSAASFLHQIKQLVDPTGRMNPGSLGL